MPTSVILLSGGVDSIVASEYMRQIEGHSVEHLFVDYGQRARKYERSAARSYCEKIGQNLTSVSIDLPSLGRMNDEPGNTGPRIVPNRNLFLLSLGANFADEIDAAHVAIGATKTDAEDYPDCRPVFFRSVSKLLNLKIEHPLTDRTRPQVLTLAKQIGVDLSDAWSCYAPIEGDPCEKCDSCRQPGS